MIDELTILLEDMANIKSQIEGAGANPDPEWLRKANFALRMKSAQQQRLQFYISQRKRDQTAELNRRFVNVAKDILEESLFQEILDNANYQLAE
jgi:guanylate kinase